MPIRFEGIITHIIYAVSSPKSIPSSFIITLFPHFHHLLLAITSILAQTLPNALSTPLPVLLVHAIPLLAQQLGGLGVRGTLVVRACKQADDAQQDSLGSLHGAPPLGRTLITVLVLLGWVQDGDAEQSGIRVDVWMEGDGVLEGEGRR